MRVFLIIITLLLAMSTVAKSEESISLLYNSRTFQIYYVVGDHYKMVHFEGTMDIMSSFFLFTALEVTKTKYLSMNSTGGYMNESYILGSFLKSRSNITFVVRDDNVCMSACAFAALSASKIIIGKNGLDFHTPYIPYVLINETLESYSKQLQSSFLGLMHYLEGVGYGIDFVQLLLTQTDTDTYVTFYSVEDLEKFKIDSFFTTLEVLPDSYKLNTR